MFQNQTSGQAKRYFRDALSKADYFLKDQEMNGFFHGKVAARLGLEDQLVTKEVFEKLCDNINPLNDQNLTPLTAKDRRVGYDISFHAPRSVSILHALGNDKRILDIFKQCVDATMRELQEDMQTRVRVQRQDHDRDTGEILWADFVHQTARPVEGHAPDPHLHCHCFTFNVTFDEKEGRFKAGQFHDLKKDMPFHQARFQKRYADKLSKIGYKIRRTNNGFEVATIPQRAIDYFSKRTNLIGKVALERGITDPKKLDQLGAETRSKKKNMSMPELQKIWREDLKKEGIGEREKEEKGTKDQSLTPQKTIDYALDHSFTRASVKRDRQILTEAYKYAVDNADLTFDSLETAFEQDNRIYKIEDGKQRLCTTLVVQTEEKEMVELARSFRGTVRPLGLGLHDLDVEGLNNEQEAAVRHVLGSSDRLTMIRGGAGTGKTYLIQKATSQIERTDRQVYHFAPTSDAKDVLRGDGFDKAETVARLLMDEELQDKLYNQVIWVDEAGMLGAKDTLDLLKLTQQKKARLVLSGDPRQHTAVLRGDAMRILQQVGRIPYENVSVTYRQKVLEYRQAVESIGKGDVEAGFNILDHIGSIKELETKDVVKQLADDYLNAMKDKKSALVISPTNEQARIVNEEIREKLRKEGKLNKREKDYTIYRNLYFTPAQKEDKRLYRPGQFIQAHQNMQGLKRGERIKIDRVEDDQIILSDGEKECALDMGRPNHYDVYVAENVTLSVGDLIRVNKNGFDQEGKRVNNGKILKISSFNKDGSIETNNAYSKTENTFRLDKQFGNLDHAYCVTSYASQGKTVDCVFIAQPAETFQASNLKQFYVSVSRGREYVIIYTDSKEDLIQNIANKEGDRLSAHEVRRISYSDKTIEMNRLDKDQKNFEEKDLDLTNNREKDHEPEI